MAKLKHDNQFTKINKILTKNDNYSPMVQRALDDVVVNVQAKIDIYQVSIGMVESKEVKIVSNIGGCNESADLSKQLCAKTIELNDVLNIDKISSYDLKLDVDTQNETLKKLGFIGVPIRRNEKAVGALFLLCDSSNNINDEQLEYLQAKADAITIALTAGNFSKQFMIEHNLLSQGPISSLIVDSKPGWPIIFVSANCYSLLGADSKADRQYFRLDDFIHPDHKTTFKRSLNFHRTTEIQDLETEYDVVLANGERKSIRQVSFGEYSNTGALLYVRLYLIDQTNQKELEVRLRKVKERSSLIIETLDLATWDLDPISNFTQVNHRWYQMIGLNFEDQEPAKNVWDRRIHPLDKKRVTEELEELKVGKRDVLNQIYRIRHESGNWIWVEGFGKTVEYNAEGKPSRIIGTQRDVTEQHQAKIIRQKQDSLVALMSKAQEIFLEESDLRAACSSIFESLLDLAESEFGFIGERITNEKGEVALKIQAISDISWDTQSKELYSRYVNDGLVFENLDNLFGRVITTENEVISNDVAKDAHSSGTPKGHPDMDCFLGLPIKFDGVVYGMIGLANRVVGYDRELIDFLKPLLANLGLLMRVRGIEAARVNAERELQSLATTDELTQLPNRRVFTTQIESAHQLFKRYGENFCVAILDIDYFKSVNDSFGHDAGDEVLKLFSNILLDGKRASDMIVRYGGEEFALLAPKSSIEEATIACERIRSDIEKSDFSQFTQDRQITVSIGLTQNVAEDESVDEIIKRADSALYKAKESGRNRVETL
ncbi:diguanylate cyclase [Alteromonas sp. W364]|uniref:diguanylate cyclase n=1 Tax=Alteromonas sp. W364 TaxID=3075610 RepID=UPI00288407DA|nr:diguanylate cyclase [Alteromonas sp. W364]MDT0628574.1 diguanylate cyclase [Alteromonas sp. W364]